jgi:MEDS: MEthanogen/methylotroph, DcmR Sensory domain
VRFDASPAGSSQGERQLFIASDAPIHLAGGILDQHRHLCAFFDSIEEEIRVFAPFVEEGLDRGEKAVHIIDPALEKTYVQLYERAGVPIRTTLQSGQFELVYWDQVYFRTGSFDQFDMLGYIEETATKNRVEGYPLTRFVGHMEWALAGRTGCEHFIEYEARINDVFSDARDPAICVYDTKRFGASVVMDVLRAHPAAITGGVLRTNPFYVPPSEFFGDRSGDLIEAPVV